MKSDISSILNMHLTYCLPILEHLNIANEFSLLQSSESSLSAILTG